MSLAGHNLRRRLAAREAALRETSGVCDVPSSHEATSSPDPSPSVVDLSGRGASWKAPARQILGEDMPASKSEAVAMLGELGYEVTT